MLANETISAAGINHLTGARSLFHFAILPDLDFKIANINVSINKRPDRRVGVKRLAAPKLFFRFLQITIADVFADGVTKNEIVRCIPAHIFRGRADDNGKFGFEISLVFGERDRDLSFVREKGSREP